jgi:flagella basal body P-ring formation protein FlgA
MGLLLLSFAIVAILSSAAAAAVIRPRVVVEDDVIRLSDLFDAASVAAQDRPIAPAPQPGRTALFDAQSLAAIAREHRVAWTPTSRFDRVIVERASRLVAAEEIEKRIAAALRRQGLEPGTKIEIASPRGNLHASPGPGDAFEVAASRLDRRDGTFAATLLLRTGADAKTQIEVRGSFYRTVAMPVLARTMRSGEVIGEGDLAWIEVRAEAKDAAAISDPKDMIGRTPRRLARAGETLKRDELKAPTVVAKGTLVTMVVETPSMTLTAKGRAIEDGADGDTIKVQNTRSHQTVEGTVAGANRVLVALPQGAVRRTAERRR